MHRQQFQHKCSVTSMCNVLTNVFVFNKTLIQMSHTKTLKITPTCFDHQLIDKLVHKPLHTRQHAKRMNICCCITTHEDSYFNQ
jgi:hypothetical protein